MHNADHFVTYINTLRSAADVLSDKGSKTKVNSLPKLLKRDSLKYYRGAVV